MINKEIDTPLTNFPNSPCRHFPLTLSKLNTAIALIFFASLISACGNRDEPEAVVAPVPEVAATPVVIPTVIVTATPTATPTVIVTATPTATPTVTVTATPKAALPNAKLVGETVTVSTKVQRVIAPNVFTVYDKESLRGQEVLVVSKQKAPAVGTNVELTGVVRNFAIADVNKNYGLNLSPNSVKPFINKPYIEAKAAEKVD
ncbi:MAG: hypothetical protein HC787_05220 [Nostocaceae cyanobacterium CSU_2_110]|nr:hypothetical protein [Nostocaceae cyanobacterium CSU_2_110]